MSVFTTDCGLPLFKWVRANWAARALAAMAVKESALKIVVFLGTVRENNYGQRAAKFITKKLQESGHNSTLLGNVLANSFNII